jgi:hypothetical protein
MPSRPYFCRRGVRAPRRREGRFFARRLQFRHPAHGDELDGYKGDYDAIAVGLGDLAGAMLFDTFGGQK